MVSPRLGDNPLRMPWRCKTLARIGDRIYGPAAAEIDQVQLPPSVYVQLPPSANVQLPPSTKVHEPPSANVREPPSANVQLPPSQEKADMLIAPHRRSGGTELLDPSPAPRRLRVAESS